MIKGPKCFCIVLLSEEYKLCPQGKSSAVLRAIKVLLSTKVTRGFKWLYIHKKALMCAVIGADVEGLGSVTPLSQPKAH